MFCVQGGIILSQLKFNISYGVYSTGNILLLIYVWRCAKVFIYFSILTYLKFYIII